MVTNEGAMIYRTPKNVDVTNSVLPPKTVLAILSETERDGFVEFIAYHPEERRNYSSSFIKTQSVSTKKSDVESSILLQIALSLDPDSEKRRRDALLETAVLECPDSIFYEEIQNILNPNRAVQIRTNPISSFLCTNDENVNVRDFPDTVTGKVIGRLENAVTEVVIVEETVEDFTVGGFTAKWYRIIEPVNGWVFGGWLQPLPFGYMEWEGQ